MGGFSREGTEAFPMGGWVAPAPQPSGAASPQPPPHFDDPPPSPAQPAPAPAPPRTTGIDLATGEVVAFGEHFYLDEGALNDINAILLGCLARIYEGRLSAIATALQLPDPQGQSVSEPGELSDNLLPETPGEEPPGDSPSSSAPPRPRRLLRDLRKEVRAATVPGLQGEEGPAPSPGPPA